MKDAGATTYLCITHIAGDEKPSKSLLKDPVAGANAGPQLLQRQY